MTYFDRRGNRIDCSSHTKSLAEGISTHRTLGCHRAYRCGHREIRNARTLRRLRSKDRAFWLHSPNYRDVPSLECSPLDCVVYSNRCHGSWCYVLLDETFDLRGLVIEVIDRNRLGDTAVMPNCVSKERASTARSSTPHLRANRNRQAQKTTGSARGDDNFIWLRFDTFGAGNLVGNAIR